ESRARGAGDRTLSPGESANGVPRTKRTRARASGDNEFARQRTASHHDESPPSGRQKLAPGESANRGHRPLRITRARGAGDRTLSPGESANRVPRTKRTRARIGRQ